eukprot:396549_1
MSRSSHTSRAGYSDIEDDREVEGSICLSVRRGRIVPRPLNGVAGAKHSPLTPNREEVAPLIPAEELRPFIKPLAELGEHHKEIQDFYDNQNSLIDGFLQMDRHHRKTRRRYSEARRPPKIPHRYQYAVRLALGINIFLFSLKLFGVVLSRSYTLIASTVDSGLDIFSGLVLYAAVMLSRRRNPYRYPQGKSRLEPIGVIVFSSIMAMTGLVLFSQSLKALIEGFIGTPNQIPTPDTGDLESLVSPIAFVLTLLLKAVLFAYCEHVLRAYPNAQIIDTLKQDQRNDLLTNSVGLVCFLAAAYNKSTWFLDPIGAMLLSVFIVYTWGESIFEQSNKLLGRSAPLEFIGQLTYLAAHHDSRIMRVDKVLAYHFGLRYLCEIDIVLPPELPLKTTHDIGESLEILIEELDCVERAFVHLDYETDHKPEHKLT